MKKTFKVVSTFMAAAVLATSLILPATAQTLPVFNNTPTPAKIAPLSDETLTAGKFNIICEDYNYGIDVTKLIVNIGQPIAVNSVDSDTFQVTAKTTTPGGTQIFPDATWDSSNTAGVRWQTSTYVCDKDGNQIKSGTGNYVLINLAHGMYQTGTTDNHRNNGCQAAAYDGLYCRYLNMNYTVTQKKTISGVSGTLTFGQNKTVNPAADVWTASTLGGLRCRSYEPIPDNKKHPLIVWLHGAGEGGPDEGMQIVANKLTALSSADNQPVLDKAFVLAPECTSIWMFGDFTAQIQSAVEQYVALHPDVDTNRIYVGGVSAGGYGAWKVLLNKPGYYAAGLIASSAYAPSDAELKKVLNKPLWLVYSDNDTTCPPASYSAKTIGQLKALGATNLHYSEFPDVISDGTRYTGHCAWNYIFDNIATDDAAKTGLNVLNWLPTQSLTGSTDTSTYSYTPAGGFTPAKNVAAITDDSLTAAKFNIICENYNYGTDVTKLIVNIGQPIPYNSVDSDTFQVTAKTYTPSNKLSFPDATWDKTNTDGVRWQDEVYVSDANGNKLKSGTGSYVVINLAHGMFQTGVLDNHPNNGCRAAVYDGTYLRWLTMNYTVTQKKTITGVDGTLTFAQNKVVNPAVDPWTKSTLNGFRCRSYEPVADGKTHPLIVWFHGMGEGGTDEGVQIIGNRLTSYSSDASQAIFGNAYVLCPETTSMWSAGNASALQVAIQSYVTAHPEIDANRIYVGGVSMGGLMAWNVLLNKPSYYAASVIAAAAFTPSLAQLQTVVDKPIWIVYSDNDTTCNPATYSGKTAGQLKSINANYHVSEIPDVISDGTRYTGHCSWNYIFDNIATDDTGRTNLNVQNWLATQTLATSKAALGRAIDTAKTKVATDYSIATWNVFAQALASANTIYLDINSTQAQIDAAAQALTTATGALAPYSLPDIAGRLTIAAPARDATTLTLPTVPAGYTVSIYSSSNRSVVALGGAITPPRSDSTVRLVLQVTKTDDGTKAFTNPISVVVPARTPDKTQLVAEIAKADALVSTMYTADTWSALQTALSAAKILNLWSAATENDVDNAFYALADAIDALVYAPNKTALKAAITMAGTIKLANYTQETADRVSAALDYAVSVSSDPAATQAQINTAYSSLIDAVLDLALNQPDPALLNAIAQGQKKDQGKYTAASWAVLDTALHNALLIVEDPASTPAQIETAKNAIIAAVSALVEKADTKSLLSAINAVSDVDTSKFLSADVAVFQAALADANAILANDESTQSQVDAATKALTEAYLNLRLKADKASIDALVAEITAIDQSKYSDESKALIQALLNKVKGLASTELSQKDFEALEAEYDTVKASLTLLSPVDTGTGSTNNGNSGNGSTGTGSTGTTITPSDSTQNPKTGDNGVDLSVIFMALCGGVVLVASKRKAAKR